MFTFQLNQFFIHISDLLEHRLIVENWNVKQYPRYTQSQDAIEAIVLEAIKEQLARRQQPDSISKNFVRQVHITRAACVNSKLFLSDSSARLAV